jgi:archaellum component FlaF (FlaF/FlaG flagellin family)
MNSIEKSKVSNLEGVNEFGDPELNELFISLDEETKNKILKISKKEIQINVLKKVQDPKLKAEYDILSKKTQKELDDLPIKDKYQILEAQIKKKGLSKPKAFEPKTPDEPLPSNLTKIAIIIPFRDSEKSKPRTKQLNRLVEYMNSYLAGYNYKIFVIEQSADERKFNRGQLLNIGFKLANAEGYNNFIFHDVDLLPSGELKEYYIHVMDKPVHIAAVWDRYDSNPNYFGGIVAFNRVIFDKINGFPNNFWGWGGEDDELLKRTKKFYDIIKSKKGNIQDLESLTLQQKLDYLKENELKFMKKQEALAEHEATWKSNGLSNLNFKELEEKPCGQHCIMYEVELDSDMDEPMIGETGEALQVPKTAPQDLFRHEAEGEVEEYKKMIPPEAFNKLVKLFYDSNLYAFDSQVNNELEVRFGTKDIFGIKRLTKNDYDNVIKVLKSFGFDSKNQLGTPSLRIRSEFLDSVSGRFKMSDTRVEIDGIIGIENYCKSNDIKTIYKNYGHNIKFTNKGPFITKTDKKLIRPVDMDDFNFRVSLQSEKQVKKGVENYIIENWRKSKKEFRYLNRVTFEHGDYPIFVDLSISKTGNKGKDNRGRSYIIPVTTIEESNVFNNQESYEIEIEVRNGLVGPGTNYQSADKLLIVLRKVIKYVLSGLQGTMYPISYPEQQEITRDYMKMIWGDEYEPSRRVTSQNFIGPNSITLQLTNIAPVDENTNIPNIRKDFVVTDKADGERHLMYISKQGKIYLISTNMDIKFTGAKTTNKDCFDILFDGELISHDKNGEFINLYAAFDIYFYKNKDVRQFTFFLRQEEEDMYKSRFYLLEKLKSIINPVSIMNTTPVEKTSMKQILSRVTSSMEISPIRFEMKKFYPMSEKQTIFDGCKAILEKEEEGLFEYETDGLIFTHIYYGVGSNVIGKAGPKTKVTWEYSFKWKPPQFNTIDFLVTTLKSPTGEDVIKTLFEDGLTMSKSIQYDQYKVIELRCGFNEKYDGYINPCQDIIDDNLPEYKPRFEEKQSNDYVPKRFYPTEPYDVNAGICNIILNLDDSGAYQMFTKEGEVITDNTIVEFSYDVDCPNSDWRWQPLRVRHDKTAKLRRGEKEYGNSYKVCNENWKSIHPTGRITKDMLMSGLDIPEVSVSEDIYYNTPSGKMKTEGLKNFHNLYVKKLLIGGAAKQGDTLIDFACGKAGDLPKWIAAKLSFVFGVDLSPDNLENRLDGACVRYLKARKVNKHMPYALFANGNSAFNIRDGHAMRNDKAKQITAAVFGNGPKEADKIGKGVAKHYGKGDSGFNVSSCQFAIHYFFQNPDTLKGFLKNVAECTKLNGYFIGTSYDGKLVFNELKKVKPTEGVQLVDEGKKVWEIIKDYIGDTFEDNSSSLSYKINVYQESINQYISEYLVNYDYFDRLMDSYGFKLISKEEANEMGLPEGSGLFSELFINMLDEIKRNKFKATLYGEAPNMTKVEKKISFLNRYFVYKKIREVNVDKLHLELGEYEEAVTQREREETKQAVVIAKEEETKIKPKVRKLSKKILLVAATEALDETTKAIKETIEKKGKNQTKTTKKETNKPKKLLIIESDEED